MDKITWKFFCWAWGDIGKAYAKPAYSVNEWGSNPDETDNDDCWTGTDFLTSEEACTAFMLLASGGADCGTAYIVLDGPDIHLVAKNPKFKPSKDDGDAEWKKEIAMEAGMLHGIEAYNDEMGY